MAADETPPSVPALRPLPSLNIPILREEVERARRRRWLAVGSALGAVGVGAASVLGVSAIGSEHDANGERASAVVPVEVGYTPPVDAAVPPADAFEPSVPLATEEIDGVRREVHRFGRSAGFRPALLAAGLTPADADAVIAALTGVLDFRRCRPEHELVVERDRSGILVRLEYRGGLTSIYEARRGPEGTFRGSRVEVPIARTDLARGGVVRTSLGDALEEVGLGRSLVGAFVEAFEGRIHFNTETRAGDAFRVIVEEERVEGVFLRYGVVRALEYRSQRRGVLRAFHFAPREDLDDFYDETGRAVHGGWLRTPLRYDHVSSPFNPRRMHPVLRRIMPHNGIDYSAPVGTPVWAAADGEVTWVGERGPNGNLVSIAHEGGYESHYAHLSRFAPGLARGQRVRQRQVIGYVGSTGRSTGPHLHFGLERRGRFIDPAIELNGPGRMLPATFAPRFRQEVARLGRILEEIEVPLVEMPASSLPPPPPPAALTEDAMD